MSDYLKVKEQLKQEKKFSNELLKENKQLKKELQEYKFLLLVKLESINKG